MGLRVNRYGPVRTIVVLRSLPRTEVPAARNSLRESTKSSTAQRVTKAPSNVRVEGTKGTGQIRFSPIPDRIAARKTIGGLSKPGNGPPPDAVSLLLLCRSVSATEPIMRRIDRIWKPGAVTARSIRDIYRAVNGQP